MASNTEIINIRQATEEDLPFIKQMCYEAGFPKETGERPSFEEAQQLQWFRDYTRDWPGQRGDFGVIAEDENGKPVGAAWYRDYPRKELSKDISTYELSIALIPEARGKGTGKKLMVCLLEGAKAQGVEGLVLQVRPENKRAKALYLQIGFQTISQSPEGYDVMVSPKLASI